MVAHGIEQGAAVRLRALRHNLRQKVAASPLMNQESFARNMEAAYRQMWHKWCADATAGQGIAYRRL